MHCPRCGTPNEPGDRYCSSCGAALEQAGESKQRTGGRDRLDRLIGTTRRARIITAATAIALIVAIVAFIALEPEDDSIPRDSYTVAADQLCLDA
ncbi:MAG TPA: zinc-ribbon domain-containing protein, partial [Solirubrobacterales bacterium]|nr:zinc-ribbon domain-containing protein [Solirubrobacterales bacterium]